MEKNTKMNTVLMVILLLFSIKSSFSKIIFTICIFVNERGLSSFFLYDVINQVISYWPSYRSEFCCIGPRRSRGPVTGPIRNYMINDNFIN